MTATKRLGTNISGAPLLPGFGRSGDFDFARSKDLSVADELLRANEEFARNFKLGELSVRPKRHVAVLACMDSRILFEHCLGLKPGDAHMIRNAGGIATDDALRSLIVSHHLLDTQEFIIINHTDCGLLKVQEYELRIETRREDGHRSQRTRPVLRLR